MDLKRFAMALWRWSWLIVLATLLAVVLSYRTVSQVPRQYMASTTLLVGQVLSLQNPTYGDVTASQQLALTYAQTVRYRPLLQATINALKLNQSWESLATNVNATAPAGSSLVRISVVDTDPARAAAIANELGRQLIAQSPSQQDRELTQQREFASQQMRSLQTRIDEAEVRITDLQEQMAQETSALRIRDIQAQITATQEQLTSWQSTYATLAAFNRGSGANTLSVLEPAMVPRVPIGPDVPLSLLLAASVGFLLAAGGALIIEYFNDTLRTAGDVTSVLGLETIGTIGSIRHVGKPADALITLRDPRAQSTESYLLLRTNILYACLGETPLTLLVTSASFGEGKSVTCANLAVSMAQSGRRTIVVDADLRRPSLHSLFGIANDAGLTSLIAAELASPRRQRPATAVGSPDTSPVALTDDDGELRAQVEAALVPTVHPNLQVLCSGRSLPTNPAEPLSSPWMARFMAALRDLADVVILDSPPMLPVADAGILAGYATGVVLVVHSERTRAPAAKQAVEALQRLHARILGAVMNRSAESTKSYYRYETRSADDQRRAGGALSKDRITTR